LIQTYPPPPLEDSRDGLLVGESASNFSAFDLLSYVSFGKLVFLGFFFFFPLKNLHSAWYLFSFKAHDPIPALLSVSSSVSLHLNGFGGVTTLPSSST